MAEDLPRIDTLPESFGYAFKGGYLGDPDLVASLVGGFCASAEALLMELGSGKVSGDRFVELSRDHVQKYADVFSGRHPDYQIVAGYNDHTLPIKLKADLGEFWQSHRKNWGDDPVCVLFEWLFVNIAESVRRADGDDDLLAIMMKPPIEGVVSRLLGIEMRKK